MKETKIQSQSSTVEANWVQHDKCQTSKHANTEKLLVNNGYL